MPIGGIAIIFMAINDCNDHLLQLGIGCDEDLAWYLESRACSLSLHCLEASLSGQGPWLQRQKRLSEVDCTGSAPPKLLGPSWGTAIDPMMKLTTKPKRSKLSEPWPVGRARAS